VRTFPAPTRDMGTGSSSGNPEVRSPNDQLSTMNTVKGVQRGHARGGVRGRCGNRSPDSPQTFIETGSGQASDRHGEVPNRDNGNRRGMGTCAANR